ncbi:Semaphorin-4D [Galemys pyrenaicus]|uniref:Semaphorin-4D n=1 Tax=Galemys pyrenaicus TaxID=202257 RepID=A0A8J6DVU3_GALPY|nr:Semaphorin-4D [Galemys pyrenaicus]
MGKSTGSRAWFSLVQQILEGGEIEIYKTDSCPQMLEQTSVPVVAQRTKSCVKCGSCLSVIHSGGDRKGSGLPGRGLGVAGVAWATVLSFDPAMRMLLLALTVVLGTAVAFAPVPRITWEHREVQLVKFHESGIFNYSALLLSEDRDTLYVGAREAVFAVSALNISKKQHEVYWKVSEDKQARCAEKGKSKQAVKRVKWEPGRVEEDGCTPEADPWGTPVCGSVVSRPDSWRPERRADGAFPSLQTECLNYIRVLQPLSATALYVCGTNAFQPICDHLNLTSFTFLGRNEDGKGRCPFDPAQSYTSVMVGESCTVAVSVKGTAGSLVSQQPPSASLSGSPPSHGARLALLSEHTAL